MGQYLLHPENLSWVDLVGLLGLFWILLAPLALAILYPVAIQYERGGLWRLLLPITLVALVLDVVLNYTSLALLTWDSPLRKEYTFSIRLERLVFSYGWRKQIARAIAVYLNYWDPTPPHVFLPDMKEFK